VVHGDRYRCRRVGDARIQGTGDPPWRTAPERLAARIATACETDRHALAAEIVNTLEATGVPHGVIVLDDLHCVADPACHDFLGFLVECLGPRWTLAISTRSEPPLPPSPQLAGAR